MKPKEFDELIRQKFDQNDFEYNSRNWDRLEEELDGRSKKRSMIMWWLMPLAGVAASVALAMGITSVLRQAEPGGAGGNETYVQAYHPEQRHVQGNTVQDNSVAANSVAINNSTDQHNSPRTRPSKKTHSGANKNINNEEEGFAINLENAIGNAPVAHKKNINLLSAPVGVTKKDKKKEQPIAVLQEYSTFKPQEEQAKPAPKFSILLATGISQGNQNNGYMAGATIRKMVSNRVYIESDVAFASSSSVQATSVLVPAPAGGNGSASARPAGAASKTAKDQNKTTGLITQAAPQYKDVNQSYNLNYIQVSPSLGVKLMKRMSIGVGPDFQQMLTDNRPATSQVTKENIAVDPKFDMGFIGKTEYSVTRNLKAGISYRKGINNVLTPMDKYVDRDYLQVQVKCAIFNK